MSQASTMWARVGLWIGLAFLLPAGTKAGTNVWTSGGPYGGLVSRVVVDPRTSVVYAGTDGNGVFRSTDGGATWVAAKAGLLNPYVLDLAIDPANPGTIFAGTQSGLYKSLDGGVTWGSASSGILAQNVFAVGIGPGIPATLYVGTYAGGVFRSTNGGQSWAAVNNGLTNLDAYVLAADPVTPGTVYVGTPGGLFKSVDSGDTWVTSGAGLPGLNVAALRIDPLTPTVVYALTSTGGIYRSTNGGLAWTAAGSPGGNVVGLTLDPTSPTTLYASVLGPGVAKSTNGGDTWTPSGSGLPLPAAPNAIAVDPAQPTLLYAGVTSAQFGPPGIFRSTNSGDSWTPTHRGLTGIRIEAVAVDPASGRIYAGANAVAGGGLYASNDRGASWTHLALPLPFGGNAVFALLVDASRSGAVLAGTFRGVFRSPDHGVTWTDASTGLTNLHVWALATDSGAPATLYAATDGGVFQSTDGGDTWAPRNTGLTSLEVRALAIDATNPSRLYAGTIGGLFRSVDQGATWVAANTGLNSLSVAAVAIDPATPATVFVGTVFGGVFKSVNAAANWSPAGLPGQWITGLTFDVSPPGTIHASTLYGGLYTSGDGALTWLPDNEALTTNSANAVAVDPSLPVTRYAATNDSVWQRADPIPLRFRTLAPCRVLDTRVPPGQALPAGNERIVPMTGSCGIPPAALAVSLNLTVTEPSAEGHLRIFPWPTLTPLASVLNFRAFQTRANGAVVALGRSGEIAVYAGIASGSLHVIVDVNGYFERTP